MRTSEIARIIRANEATLAAMADDLANLDLRDQIDALDVPVLFLLGSNDRVLDPRIAQAFLEELDAPFQRSGSPDPRTTCRSRSRRASSPS